MVILSHPTGNANVRAASLGLIEAELLFEFYTAIASFPGSLLDRLGAIQPLSEIRRRRFDPALAAITKTSPWLEAGRLLASKAGLARLITHETGAFCIDAVYRGLDKRVALDLKTLKDRRLQAVYAYEDGAFATFRKAKSLGLQCFYDLPIGYWRAADRLMEQERELWPDWSSTLIGFNDSEAKLNRKDEELQLADHIFVASRFTAETLQEFPGKLAPVKIIPYGFPPVREHRSYLRLNKPLKLLFVGGLSQRKGIANLFAAVKNLGHHVKLTIVGNKLNNNCPALNSALRNHQWIPSMPHDKVLKLMSEHDVLVFPSLFEGFGLVITEAMSQGTPVITTDRTAGPDLIQNNNNGWIVKAGSTEALQTAIEKLLDQPETIAEAGQKAMATARLRPWEQYGKELADAILGNSKIIASHWL